MRKIIPLLFVITMLAGGSLTSCKRYPVDPPDTTHKCDTCCDTCKVDTTKVPCDTCNIDKDSAAHAFIWTEYTIPSETNLTGVWVFGPNDIMICANSLWHFDGTSFSLMDPIRNGATPLHMNGALNGNSIFAFSQNEFWLFNGGVAYHTTDGQHFDDKRPGSVHACWGSSPKDVFFVGNSGHITHWDGTKFEEMNSGTTKDLRSVWGTSHNDVWAAGFNPLTAETVVLHYDGNTWNSIDLSIFGKVGNLPHNVGEVWACDSSGHYKAIFGGSLIWRNTDNTQWQNDSAGISNRLSDGSFVGLWSVQGNSSTDILAAGDGGFISHWNGKSWKRYEQLFNPDNPNYATNAMSMKDNTACVVGFKNGQSWMAVGRRK